MPLAVISLRHGTTLEYRRAIADSIHQAMMEALHITRDDRFQLINEYPPEHFIHDRIYYGVERSERAVFIQITISHRDLAQRRALYDLVPAHLAAAPGVRREDVFINLVEVARENWWAYARSAPSPAGS